MLGAEPAENKYKYMHPYIRTLPLDLKLVRGGPGENGSGPPRMKHGTEMDGDSVMDHPTVCISD